MATFIECGLLDVRRSSPDISSSALTSPGSCILDRRECQRPQPKGNIIAWGDLAESQPYTASPVRSSSPSELPLFASPSIHFTQRLTDSCRLYLVSSQSRWTFPIPSLDRQLFPHCHLSVVSPVISKSEAVSYPGLRKPLMPRNPWNKADMSKLRR
jgi:hypothetical protein